MLLQINMLEFFLLFHQRRASTLVIRVVIHCTRTRPVPLTSSSDMTEGPCDTLVSRNSATT